MGATTYKGRVRRALLHKTESDYWVAVGRTTEWDDEDAPPSPSPAATDIEEAIVFVAAQTVSLCKPVSSGGDVSVAGQEYELVDDADAYTENARFLYISARFEPSAGQPAGNYRQKGIFSNLVPQSGYESATWLAPANVSDRGTLEYIANKTVKTLSAEEDRLEKTVIEFR